MSSSFGRALIAERQRLGIRQWDAAELLGVSVRTVKSWENDDSPPKTIWQVGALAILRAIPER
ncbi:helix-turn-helix transcriptional regulator, partial [Escherichia coli]|uniref:helix-turn-helix transcriptional regulator n=1 Tax=Escherichia coli TaxID=562 RepID=UPI00244CACA5